ncbi:DNA/RNA nuclease SfsA [Fervidibacillus halotolerans]|uniref:Sugar fermentation stimulation protein homolog n=1 Tax=Fervidibacillus halotolerans TaxID=2980027 RepID=A0A9E8M0T9_9BACI|nr:DNA/RNA nuclease SfsA [Fervidibacillus halotolerans]WAA13129.1 DNA/RNA nuclease SfsA [Fervidibacillus halotolerans]
MEYGQNEVGTFMHRVNRFIAEVSIRGKIERVHVKNTGRLKELLIEGATVLLEEADHPNRKTKYSLVTVKKGDKWVNIDSQAPNIVVYDALMNKKIKEFSSLDIFRVKKEVYFKKSRFDLFFQGEKTRGFIEIKGVTLENNGVAMFPDAPTVRGTKHIYEMVEAVEEGYIGILFFLIQMDGCRVFSPNKRMDPSFTKALLEAREAGVHILAYDSIVTEKGLTIGKSIGVQIE